MAVFEYTALNPQGRRVKGIVDADSARAARAKLKRDGIFPTGLRETTAKRSEQERDIRRFFGSRVGMGPLSIATRQLATLVAAGMPLVEGLKALGDQLDHPALKSSFADITDRVNEGSTLAEAIRQHPRVFPELYPNMVASGEASGTLDLVLERLADLLESSVELRRKVAAATTYPILMLFLCIGVVIILLAVVVPQLTQIFEDQGKVLPLPTQVIIALSDGIRVYWYIWLAILILIPLLIRQYVQSDAGKTKFHGMLLSLPGIGAMSTKISTARFARTLGTMLESGVGLLSALKIVRNVLNNVVIRGALDEVIERVREGKTLSTELEKTGLFPRMLIHMISIGERSGRLEPMLNRAASAYESEMDAVVAGITAILNPILILFLAAIVGMILLAVLLPMLEMTSMLGN